MHFDYSPFNISVSLRDRIDFVKNQSVTYRRVFFGVSTVFMLLFLIIFVLFVVGLATNDLSLVAFMIIFSGMLLLAFVLVLVWFLLKTRFSISMRRFAAANGIEFYEGSSQEDRPGMMFNEGYDRRFNGLFTLRNQHAAEIANYQYTTGSGKSQQTHKIGYIRMKLPRKLPHIVLDSRKNNMFGISNLPEYFGKTQRLQLEGNFNEYFNLYVPNGYERDALYIFTPDVMQLMMQGTAQYDSEIVDDDLFIYRVGKSINFRDTNHMEELMGMADLIHTKLSAQTDYYADERVGDRAQNIVAEQGKRLRVHVPWWSIAIFVAYLIYVIVRIVL